MFVVDWCLLYIPPQGQFVSHILLPPLWKHLGQEGTKLLPFHTDSPGGGVPVPLTMAWWILRHGVLLFNFSCCIVAHQEESWIGCVWDRQEVASDFRLETWSSNYPRLFY